jgi:hypothetical protein
MPALDATLGGPSANSYITVAEADGLLPVLVSKARSTAWLDLGDTDKENYLMRAVKMIETYIDFDGVRVLNEQPLAWPRDWVYGPERCTAYAADELPRQIGEAQALLAISLSEGFDQTASGGAPIDKLKLSSLSLSFVVDRSARGTLLLPAEVVETLRGFGDYVGSTGGARSIKLVRA